jgi:hypothetical protein
MACATSAQRGGAARGARPRRLTRWRCRTIGGAADGAAVGANAGPRLFSSGDSSSASSSASTCIFAGASSVLIGAAQCRCARVRTRAGCATAACFLAPGVACTRAAPMSAASPPHIAGSACRRVERTADANSEGRRASERHEALSRASRTSSAVLHTRTSLSCHACRCVRHRRQQRHRGAVDHHILPVRRMLQKAGRLEDNPSSGDARGAHLRAQRRAHGR